MRLKLDSLYSLRMNKTTSGGEGATIAAISTAIANKECALYSHSRDFKTYKKAVVATSSLIRGFADRNLRHRRDTLRVMISELLLGIEPVPKYLLSFINQNAKKSSNTTVSTVVGIDDDRWIELLEVIHQETEYHTTPFLQRLVADVSVPPVGLNAAAALASMAEHAGAPDGTIPEYDKADSKVLLRKVTVQGFRGAPEEISVDLAMHDKPVCLLLWGDNGVGKSTVIDGIEFALQGRVDRSADFNSGLRPSVKNLAVPMASATVQLTDGTSVERQLKSNDVGRDVTSSVAIRPGFRIAPLAIRRADILRFLDTETLSRSMIFFDYFPSAGGTLGLRPDEQLRMLEEERFTLRLLRDKTAEELLEHYPASKVNFTNQTHFENFLQNKIRQAKRRRTDNSDPLAWAAPVVRELISSLKDIHGRLSKIKKTLERGIENLNPILYRDQLSRIAPVLHSVTDDLTASFQRLTKADHVDSIQVLVAKSGPVSLDVLVTFKNGKTAFPQQVFSEAYKDLIALLFFLSVTKKAGDYGQAKILILDDVLQSVDSTVRVEVMDYVLEEFKGWQIIITGHDRSWLNQLRPLFNNRGVPVLERHITRWSFDGGIYISDSTWTTVSSLRNALDRSDPLASASATGLLLEQVCQELSWRVQASIIRRKDDRYTLNDLWSGVAKVLKKSTLVKVLVEDVNKNIALRNLLGGHYNSWAAGISWRDVSDFGEAALRLHESVHCSECRTWIEKRDATSISCKCHKLTL